MSADEVKKLATKYLDAVTTGRAEVESGKIDQDALIAATLEGTMVAQFAIAVQLAVMNEREIEKAKSEAEAGA